MRLTPEQARIIEMATEAMSEGQAELEGGRLINAPGVAGAGKSAIIVELARRDACRRILFLSQSRNLRDRARATLPPNVMAMTVQEAAHRYLLRLYAAKLKAHPVQGSLTEQQMLAAGGAGTTQREVQRARQVLYRFYRSAHRHPEPSHLPSGNRPGEEWALAPADSRRVLRVAIDVWFSQISREPDSAPLTYAAEVKLWTQSATEQIHLEGLGRSISVSPLHGAELVILEESQDADEAQLGLLSRQNIAVVMFGDAFQSLRQGNRRIKAQRHPLQERADTVYLRDSFRFGASIASLLNALAHRAGSPRVDRCIGRGESNVYPSAHRYQWESQEVPYTVITSSSAGLFQEALEATQRGKRISWVDGVESYPVGLVRDLAALRRDGSVRGAGSDGAAPTLPSLAGLRSLEEARARFRQRWDSTGLELCDWVETAGLSVLELPEIIDRWRDQDRQRQEAMQDASQSPPERDLTLTTVARAKGHEWGRVAIIDDCFPSVLLQGRWQLAKRDRPIANRAYTAISRAQIAVAVSEAFLKHLEDYGVVLAPNSFPAGEEVVADERVHSHFGCQRHAQLEMSHSLRRRRMALKPPRRASNMASGHLQLKEQVEEQAEALKGHSVDELRAMLRARGRNNTRHGR
ncbi:hypothetical protein [Halomonas sp. LBP4]|uniref:hypothetical protein n=1 Tax=Halomonas sp. LBP4 TaxID=2044917 RepID=UPI000D758592|nr:hypothetical protein [Halomonas sp. LBP4]PXX94676.1 hypothetical protein CR157_21465 [Halomonas sp. LBP4]